MGRRAREQHCTPPGATTGNNKKHVKRPRAGKKAGGYGEDFMLYRIFDKPTKKYARCGPTTKGREQGSRVHRFGREIGFEAPAVTVAADCGDPVIKAARDAQRSDVTSVSDSHSDRRTKQGYWERYVLGRHQVGQPHHAWLVPPPRWWTQVSLEEATHRSQGEVRRVAFTKLHRVWAAHTYG